MRLDVERANNARTMFSPGATSGPSGGRLGQVGATWGRKDPQGSRSEMHRRTVDCPTFNNHTRSVARLGNGP